MKNFKIQVNNNEVKFFMELLDRLDFVQYEPMDNFSEPRVYPAADFEIRSVKNDVNVEAEQASKPDVEEVEKSKKDALSEIRNVISQIDRLRDRTK